MTNILLYTLLSAYAFRWRGDDTLNKPEWLILTVLMCFSIHEPLTALCWVWVYIILGVFPTQSCFTAIHGRVPSRRDHWAFAWMQDISGVMQGGKWRGIVYCFVRSLPIVPVLIFIPSAAVILLSGIIYYLAGTPSETDAVKRAEYVLGGLLGLSMALPLFWSLL